MRKNWIHIIIVIFIFASCNQRNINNSFDKIELVVYYWRDHKIPYKDNFYLTCTLFASISKTGECKLMAKNGDAFLLKNFQIPDTLLSQISDSLTVLKNDIDIHPDLEKVALIYDGPEIRTIIYSNGMRRTIDFIDHYEYSEHVCFKLYNYILYNYIKELNSTPIFMSFEDTSKMEVLRMNELVIIYDSFYKNIYGNNITINKPRHIK